jgi:hypothetical protein
MQVQTELSSPELHVALDMSDGQRIITVRQLLEAGVHFGHRTERWNPRMKPYIYGARNGIHIIDLQQTAGLFNAGPTLHPPDRRPGQAGAVRRHQEAGRPRRDVGGGAALPASTTCAAAGWAAR